MYYEIHERIDEAIHREKQMKEWNRNWKLRQIIDKNPDWKDLYEEIIRWIIVFVIPLQSGIYAFWQV